jgi:hypothetical protein
MLRLVVGDLLNKRPNAKKVETFLSKQLREKVDSLTIDAKIKSK